MKTFAVLIPTKNEVRNIPNLVEYIDIFDEVIFVDADSTDGTQESIIRNFPNSKLISQLGYKGKGSALCLGLLEAKSDYVLILDADLPVSLVEVRYLRELCSKNESLDLVKTSRHLLGGGSSDLTIIRNTGAKFFALITRLLFRVQWTEMCYGFWIIKVSRVPELGLLRLLKGPKGLFPFHRIPYGLSFEFDQVIFLRAFKKKFNILEIASSEIERTFGKSNLFAPVDGLRTLLVIFKERLTF